MREVSQPTDASEHADAVFAQFYELADGLQLHVVLHGDGAKVLIVRRVDGDEQTTTGLRDYHVGLVLNLY